MKRPFAVSAFSVIFGIYFLVLLALSIQYVLKFGILELFGNGVFGIVMMILVGLLSYGFWMKKNWVGRILIILFIYFLGKGILSLLGGEGASHWLMIIAVLFIPFCLSGMIFYVHKNKELFSSD